MSIKKFGLKPNTPVEVLYDGKSEIGNSLLKAVDDTGATIFELQDRHADIEKKIAKLEVRQNDLIVIEAKVEDDKSVEYLVTIRKRWNENVIASSEYEDLFVAQVRHMTRCWIGACHVWKESGEEQNQADRTSTILGLTLELYRSGSIKMDLAKYDSEPMDIVEKLT
jgi:hypothetical protein